MVIVSPFGNVVKIGVVDLTGSRTALSCQRRLPGG